jgi:hypothetical protein
MLKPMTPRQSRVAHALLNAPGWIAREAIDRIAAASNGPEVIRQLRHRLGYDAIEMERINTVDRDGLPTQPGRYRLTPKGRAKLAEKDTPHA